VLYDQSYTDDKKLDLYLPVCSEEAPRAAIVMIHGGGWVAGDKRQAREQRFGKVLASNGYLCADIEYKLAGKDDPSWPQCLYDCKNAVKFLRKNAAKYNIDPEKIAVMGGSAGGHLALMTAFTGGVDKYKSQEYEGIDDRVCAVINLYGITNALTWRYFGGDGRLKTNTDLLTGGGVEENAQLWIDASPVYAVTEDAPPTLIMHGTADKVVSIEQSIELAQVLEEKGVEHKFIRVEAAPHSFTFDSTKTNYWPVVLEFLRENTGE
jgi:acetyl esterase/lipase